MGEIGRTACKKDTKKKGGTEERVCQDHRHHPKESKNSDASSSPCHKTQVPPTERQRSVATHEGFNGIVPFSDNDTARSLLDSENEGCKNLREPKQHGNTNYLFALHTNAAHY